MENRDTEILERVSETTNTKTGEFNGSALTPKLCGWHLQFLIRYGFENRDKVMKSFVKFLNSGDPEDKFYQTPGDCVLCGEVYGHPKFPNKSGIFTSPVVSVERLKLDFALGKRHDLLCATTESGNHYYFYSDDCSTHMTLMLDHMKNRGKLSRWPGRYLERKEWGKCYL